MKQIESIYPRREAFLRYAAANCGIPAIHEGSHEAVEPNSELILFVPERLKQIPERKLRQVKIQINMVRAGELALNRACNDRPFEGTVVQSDHKEIKRGQEVIGLASRDCEALLVDTTNARDMEHLVRTFTDPEYRGLVTA